MQTTKFVESYFDAWNQSDPQGVANHLAVDGVYRDVPLNTQRTHDEMIEMLGSFFQRNPHRYELIGEVLVGTASLAFQYDAYAVDRDTGKRGDIVYSGAEFMQIDGNAAITISDFYGEPRQATANKYAKSGLRDDQMQEYKRRLEHIMVAERAYLEPSLTLPLLAEAVGCSVNHLSQVINAGFGVSFFDYLNSHRIRHAKTLLKEMPVRGRAILNVAFTVGFNSNSAFYAAFKKHVGMTPAQYRRQ